MVHGLGWIVCCALGVALIYLSVPLSWRVGLLSAGGVLIVGSGVAYLALRPAARRLVWPPVLRASEP